MSKQKTNRILLINGANLNVLGTREPETYGDIKLIDIENRLKKQALLLNASLEAIQSNREYEIIDAIQSSPLHYTGIIINPGAFTHTSIAIRDAFLSVNTPFYEIHISNIYTRESFRHISYLSDIANGVIIGCGVYGYDLALRGIIDLLNR